MATARFGPGLRQAWETGFVADITLVDGDTECSAVLIAMSSTALILDRWDGSRRAPAGDPSHLSFAPSRRSWFRKGASNQVVPLKASSPKFRLTSPCNGFSVSHR